MKTRLIFAFVSVLFYFGFISAQGAYTVTYLTMNNGLHHNFIDYIYKDSQGFMWFATGGGGICRYDGYDCVHFNAYTGKSKLKSNFIKEVCEDDFGRLWVVSEGGVDVLSLSTLQQTLPNVDDEVFTQLIHQPTLNIYKDSKGAIWLYSLGKVHKLTFGTQGEILRIQTVDFGLSNIQTAALSDVDLDGDVWIGIGNHIYKIYTISDAELKATPKITNYTFDEELNIHLFQLKENEIWIATSDGLFRYNLNNDKMKSYRNERRNARSLTQDFITSLAVTSEKTLLVGTLKGLNIYDPISDDFTHMMQQDKDVDKEGLNSNFINHIFVDQEKIWIGTETGGINKLTPKRFVIRNYSHNKNVPYSISENLINSICEDVNGALWVGTVEGGLNRKNRNSERFTCYTTDNAPYLAHNSVSAIASDGSGRLWIGSWGRGITILDRNKPDSRALKYISTGVNAENNLNYIGVLCYDAINNGMWIGANPGVLFYDIETEKMHFPFDRNIADFVHGCIGCLIDTKGRLWIGSMDGVYVIDLHSEHHKQFDYQHYKYKLDDPDSHLIEKASCFYQANDGTIWIGTNGYGFYRCEENDEGFQFVAYTMENGLANNSVRGILEDDNGLLWISTNNGLSNFNPSTESFVNISKDDGLAGNQFYWNAYCKSATGLLYFGGVNGLTEIDPARRIIGSTPSKVTLTKLNIMNEEVPVDGRYLQANIAETKELRLHERDKSFSLEFSTLNYDTRDEGVYKYRLLGFEDDWVALRANRRYANYTNMKPGTYTFQVKYVPDNAKSDIQTTELKIVIKPFFYKEPWFIFLVCIFIISVIVYSYVIRVQRLSKQKALLHRTVNQRTKELALQNETLKEQNEKISNQKAQLLTMSKKVQELTTDKLAFFTNIAHEFRTPVTLIIGPIEKALKLSHNPAVIEQLNYVKRNSRYLLLLVNQLMDFRKVESEKLEVNNRRGDFIAFIDSVITPFAILAEERHIELRRFYRLTPPEIIFDEDITQKIVANLLSNALKFTPENGVISVYVTEVADLQHAGKRNLCIVIKDTGVGINEADRERIFDRFYQATVSAPHTMYGQAGTGIGLYLTKQIVDQLHGDISVRNNGHGKNGTSFIIKLPMYGDDTVISTNPPDTELHRIDKANVQTAHFVPNLLTILVVEDNKDMRGYIRSVLAEKYNILEAENGAEALEILSVCNVDFIISDLMMPVMDGIELSQRVKENLAISHIPFLMLTAKVSEELRLESYKIGVDEYLLKPFDEELLLTRIQNILDSRKRYQQKFANKMETESLNMDKESKDKVFIDKAVAVIHANYNNPDYEAAEFITAMGMSKSLLNKKMQNLTGQSIGQFIRNYRLNIAHELIEANKTSGLMNVSQIAYEVGFNDPKYFTRCFTKRFNYPPSSLLEK